MAQEKILLDIEISEKDLTDKLVSLEAQLLSLNEQKKEVTAEYKKGNLTLEETAQANIALQRELKEVKDAQKDVNRELNLNTTITESATNSYENLTAQYALGQKRLKELEGTLRLNENGTIELSDAYKEQFEALANLKTGLIQFDLAIKNGGTSVGLYDKTLEGAKEALNGLTGGLFDNAKAFLANPIGIFVALVSGLIGVLSQSRAVTDALSSATAGLGQIFDVVFKIAKPLIDLIAKGITIFADFASEIAQGFDKGSESASKLQKQLIDIDRAIESNIVNDAKLLSKEEELKLLRDDTSKGIQASIDANVKLGKVEQERIAKSIELDIAKRTILEKQVATMGDTNARLEKQKELNELNKGIAEKIADSAGKQTEQITNQNSKLKEQADLKNEISDLDAKIALLSGKVAEGSSEELKIQQTAIEAKRRASLIGNEKNKEETERINKEAKVAELELNKAFNDKLNEQAKDANDKRKEQAEKFEQERREKKKTDLENDIKSAKKGSDDETNAKLALLTFNFENEKKDKKQRFDKLSEIDLKFELEKAQIQEDALKADLIAKANFELEKQKLELANGELSKEQKSKLLLDIIAIESNLRILQLEDSVNFENEKLIIEKDASQKKKDQIQLDYENELALNEEKLTAKLELDALNNENALALGLENDTIYFDARLALELEQEEARRLALVSAKGITEEQIQQINALSEAKQVALKLANDKRKLDSEQNLAKKRTEVANDLFNASVALFGKESDLAKAAFEIKRAFAIGEVIQNGIREIQDIASKPNFLPEPASSVFKVGKAIFAGVKTAGAVAQLASQSFADGGVLEGPTHSNGGIRGTGRFSNVEVEGGEFIVNRVATQRFLPQLEQMNSYKFANGGVLPASTNQTLDAFALTNAVANIRFPQQYVAVTDINLGQDNLTQVNDIAIL